MSNFIKLPNHRGDERPAIVNLELVSQLYLDISSTPKFIYFKTGDSSIIASFSTVEEAEEFYDKVSKMIISEI